MKVALGQINPTIGDFEGNRGLCLEALSEAEARGADLLLLPELALSGYPPKDLLGRPSFIEAARRSLDELAARAGRGEAGTALLVGFPERLPPGAAGRRVANSAALCDEGRVLSIHRKLLLPTYDVFDEWRHFEPAERVEVAAWRGRRLAVTVCEDVWNDADFWPQRRYREDPVEKLVQAGAEIILNLSASPYTLDKRHLRPRMLAATARRWRRPLCFCNQVGGQDDLVFDGASIAVNAQGEIIARAAEHARDLVLVDLAAGRGDVREAPASDARSALAALVLGTRDYARRCGFERALLGLSGGIDSALVACIAVRALGAENVLGVALPSRFSSEGSRRDARALAARLGMGFREISIEPAFSAFESSLAPHFPPQGPGDLTRQNIQPRARMTILMALSNEERRLLLTTGNKSEIATGYCTLYGDLAGGLAVISDVPKTLVYDLAREVNAERELIPRAILEKAPSAELKPGQTDQDTLPPYPLLDSILEAHLERGLEGPELVAAGFSPAVVEDVLRRVRTSEYKRRQMPPGLKITGKAFGPGRRMPIAAWGG